MVQKRNALGKGLSDLNVGKGIEAILGVTEVSTSGALSMNEIDIDKIEANPNQPRTMFDEEALNELAESICEHGIIQPITLRKISDDKYQIISGERRWRASQIAGLTRIPAYVKDVDDDKDVELMALVENLQREDLNAIEIALSYQKLTEEFHQTQEELSKKVGKKRVTISNYLRLLKLPSEIQIALQNKTLDMGHARALITIDDAELQLDIFKQICEKKLSVRAVEELVSKAKNGENPDSKGKTAQKQELAEEFDNLRQKISASLKRNVQFSANAKGKGKISIPFANIEELESLMELFDKLSEK